MVLRSGFDPVMPWVGYEAAKAYMGRLNKLGHLVMALAASKLVGFVVTAPIAIAISAVVLGIAFILANDYRRYDKELVKNTNLWGVLSCSAMHGNSGSPCFSF